MASFIGSFVPKNLLRVLSPAGPQRVGRSIIIRCANNSARDNKPTTPKIKKKDPQTNDFPKAKNETIQTGGEAMFASLSTREDKSSKQASSQ
ncbi:unnamed protein product [Coffea canephora]|uniref:Uncharacterized protein n=1 Tax=Coffea canephora TaxID=49390 RepID=A0A068V0W4_COFCA|nr:unnamed protein product [Coffea canephora]